MTGASRGIGKSIALLMARNGAKVVASARNLELLDSMVAEIKAFGGEAIAVAGDISRTEDANNLIAAAVESFGRIDILVNNAGITHDGLLLRMKDEDWDSVLNINLKGAFICTRAAAK